MKQRLPQPPSETIKPDRRKSDFTSDRGIPGPMVPATPEIWLAQPDEWSAAPPRAAPQPSKLH